LGELVETFEALMAERPLVLVLEDLQWGDYATLDFLSMLIQRQGPGRLLLLATYRPADVLVNRHPLRALTQELFIHGSCQELPLGGLTEPAIQDYVVGRFGPVPFLETLSAVLSRQTEGCSLFMGAVLEEWMSHGLLVQKNGTWQLAATEADLLACIPDRTQQLLARQLDRLSPEERHVLNVASVVGTEFSAAAVAAGLEQEVYQIEERCESLAHRHQLLQSSSQGCLTAAGRPAIPLPIGARARDGVCQHAGRLADALASAHRRLGRSDFWETPGCPG
jgi:predicted ATPase